MRFLATKVFVLALSLNAIAMFVGADASRADSKSNLSKLGAGAAEVTLIDTLNKPVKWKTFKGQKRVLFFGFTHCPVVCPVTVWEIDAALNDIGSAANVIKILFVTLDPARDTSAALAKYFLGFNGRVLAHTGAPTEIAQLAKSFNITFQRVDTSKGEYTIDHTATAFLIDADGKVVDTLAFGASRETSVSRLKALLSGPK